MIEIAQYIDHTNLKPEAVKSDIHRLCMEAVENKFFAVCVHSSFAAYVYETIQGLQEEYNYIPKIAVVVGFPLGACATEAKAFEAAYAVTNGADEIDMVIHIGKLKEKDYEYVKNDIKAVIDACQNPMKYYNLNTAGSKSIKKDVLVKVILETCLLSEEEIIQVCRLASEAGADFVKTSTGFSSGGATTEHVELMKRSISDNVKVKASGGIRDRKQGLAMINAGADRLGVSASLAIVCDESHVFKK